LKTSVGVNPSFRAAEKAITLKRGHGCGGRASEEGGGNPARANPDERGAGKGKKVAGGGTVKTARG